MSSVYQSTYDHPGLSADVSVDVTLLTEDDFNIEEIDVESPEGRSLLIHEIENLALTCDVANDAELFADSAVFAVVAELQSALAEVEEIQLRNEEVTDLHVQTVQDLYDQLAVEVEQPSIVSVYLGPSRKDMVLEDLGEEGSIFIVRQEKAQEVPISQPAFIHNSLLKGSVTKVRSFEPESVTKKQETFYKPDSAEVTLQKIINRIEATELSLLDAWICDYQSPYKVLGDMSFAELQRMVAAPINSRAYVEFKSLLELQRVKYEVFGQWSQLFYDMDQVVDRAIYKSFKEVVDEYLLITST